MLDDLFLSVLNMSLVASFVIIFVLLARLALKKAPKIFSYVLWSIVLLRLLCPFSFESIFSLIPINRTPIPQNIIYSQTPQISTGMTVVDNMINPILPAPTDIGASINPIQVWLFIGEIIWILGIIAMAAYSIVSFAKLKRSLITATPLKDNIYLADHIATPFVLGVIRPKIYLPSSLLESEQNYIIGHELCHIKRLDHITRILGFIALSVHWFNPFVWVAFALSGKDMELSCDEAVMKSIDSDIKAEYSGSLLRFGTTKKMLHATPLAFGEGDTKSRIKNVLNYKKPAFWVVIVAAVSCAVMIICFSSNPIRLPFDFSTNAVISAFSLDKRESDDPAAVELTEEQIQELMSRIDNISSVKQSDEYGGFTPLYSVSAQLADNTHFFVNGYAYDSDKIDIVYQDKAYKITDAQFADYFNNVFEAKELWAMRPMVMINGILYLDTGKEGPMGDSNAVSGTIKSTVSGDKKPTEHEQSNFGFVGSKYADGGDFIQVNIDDKWIVFEREKSLTHDQAVIKALSTSSNRYLGDECFGEGHIILGTEEDGDTTKIYTLTMVGYYGFVNNNFEKVSGSGIIPAVVTLKNNNEVDIEYPKDGSDYASSIKEMFPLKYHSRIFGDNDSDRKDLTEQERAYAKEYLSKIGRKAEIGDYGDFEHTILTSLGVSVEVSNGLEDFYKAHNYYPYFIGTKEIIEDGVRMFYELSYQESQQEITFTKYLYDSKKLVEQFVFNSITGKQIAQ